MFSFKTLIIINLKLTIKIEFIQIKEIDLIIKKLTKDKKNEIRIK